MQTLHVNKKVSWCSNINLKPFFRIFLDLKNYLLKKMTKRKKNSIGSNKMSAYVWLIFLLKQLSIGKEKFMVDLKINALHLNLHNHLRVMSLICNHCFKPCEMVIWLSMEKKCRKHFLISPYQVYFFFKNIWNARVLLLFKKKRRKSSRLLCFCRWNFREISCYSRSYFEKNCIKGPAKFSKIISHLFQQ